jgi:hypothetical protein
MKARTERIILAASRAMLEFPEGQRGELAQHVGAAFENDAQTAMRDAIDAEDEAYYSRLLATVRAELVALGLDW